MFCCSHMLPAEHTERFNYKKRKCSFLQWLYFYVLTLDVQIRLSGSGSTRCSGRVEVYYNNTWGTVCDYNWGLYDAHVVCRQLDCGIALSATQSAHFGEGTGPIWLDEVACSLTESSLTECGHRGFGTHNCSHSQDAGVVCSGEKTFLYNLQFCHVVIVVCDYRAVLMQIWIRAVRSHCSMLLELRSRIK